MASRYSELVAFTKAHASDPVALAKVLTSWSWAALLPGGYGREPADADDVPAGLNASCGWRDVLMKDLFAQVGIEGRRVNFYDVPYQGGHTATELKIDGKWMFFDATFGIYFTARGSDVPLSIADATRMWPNVEVRQSTLEGWQGAFLDPDSISAAGYSVLADFRLYQPEGFRGAPRVLGGEVNSLYFGPDTAYYIDGVDIPVVDGHFSWKERVDRDDTKDWDTVIDRYYDGVLDTRSGLSDNGSRWFVDYDQGDRHDWSSTTSYVSARSRLDREVTVMDDASSIVIDWDQDMRFDWDSIKDTYGPDGELLSRRVENDDGTVSTPNILNLMEGGLATGTAGEDLIVAHAGRGAVTVDGGEGMDSALFRGARGNYRLEFEGGSSATISLGGDSWEMSSVESLVFSDQTVLVPHELRRVEDVADEFPWVSSVSTLDASGRQLSARYEYEDGSTSVYAYDVLDQFAWDYTLSRLEDGSRILALYQADDRSRVIYQYDAHSQTPWSRITKTVDAHRDVTSVAYQMDDSSTTVYQYDTQDRQSWSTVTTYMDQSGKRERVIYENDDGSSTVYQYDLGNSRPWWSIETKFGADGTRQAIVYAQDAGDFFVYGFAADGATVVSQSHFSPDWQLIA